MHEIWFWQRIISPHMAGLATALAKFGCKVTYVAEKELTTDRVKLGWRVPSLSGVRLLLTDNRAARNSLISDSSAGSVHLCQGVRGNGSIYTTQRELAGRNRRQWALMETVDDSGVAGTFKRWEYGRQFRNKERFISRILAIGYKTRDWVIDRGMAADRVSSFAYFLPDPERPEPTLPRQPGPFRFLFAGRFIPLKRLDLLIGSLQKVKNQEFELLMIGAGPQEKRLRRLAESALPGRVRWLGIRPQSDVTSIMGQADCLVLPSRHDGWGAVVTEAMMTGTPVVCSDACGVAGVVEASGVGGIFPRDQVEALCAKLDQQVKAGPIDIEGRIRLATWASALGAEAGAQYLIKILDYEIKGGVHPLPPWQDGGG